MLLKVYVLYVLLYEVVNEDLASATFLSLKKEVISSFLTSRSDCGMPKDCCEDIVLLILVNVSCARLTLSFSCLL